MATIDLNAREQGKLHEIHISSGYAWDNSSHTSAHAYLLPTLTRLLAETVQDKSTKPRIFDVGCGNGSVANYLSELGYDVFGVDPSTEGIRIANQDYPNLRLEMGSAYDDLAARFGIFDIVVSLEVVEHVYAPRLYAQTLHRLLRKGGTAIISTPYHGYWKNLAVALAGGFDGHFTALLDHGHIKFWSMKTLRQLLEEAGFAGVVFYRVGRIPALAKSMIAVCRKR